MQTSKCLISANKLRGENAVERGKNMYPVL